MARHKMSEVDELMLDIECQHIMKVECGRCGSEHEEEAFDDTEATQRRFAKALIKDGWHSGKIYEDEGVLLCPECPKKQYGGEEE